MQAAGLTKTGRIHSILMNTLAQAVTKIHNIYNAADQPGTVIEYDAADEEITEAISNLPEGIFTRTTSRITEEIHTNEPDHITVEELGLA